MKIAIIIRRLNIMGGTQRLAMYEAEELKKKGHTVKFYTLFLDKDRSYTDALNKLDITALDFQQFVKPVPIGFLKPLYQLFAESRAARAIAEKIDQDTDLLNPHDQVSYRVTRYFRKYKNPNVPSVWNMNDPPSLAWAYARERANDAVRVHPLWKRAAYALYDWYDARKFISEQDAIITQDARNIEWLNTYYGPYIGRKGVTCRNGPEVGLFSYQARRPLTKRVRLLSSGILFSHRRYQDAIRAVKLLSDRGFEPSLEIIGETSGNKLYYEFLTKLVVELGVGDRIKFLASISEEELIRRYHESDIFLYQHHWQTDGLSPTEAMFSGMVAVVSRTAGAAEILKDHETGMVIEPKDPEGIARAIEELIAKPELYLKLSKQGSEWVRENLSPQLQFQQIWKVFENAREKGKRS
jgi:glycosyltransferase involved in cell wall biosynthesis